MTSLATPPNPLVAIDDLEITGWVTSPSATAGISFLDENWSWRTVPYRDLAQRVVRLRDALVANGLSGQRAAVLAANPESFVALLFAVFAAGGTCVPVTPLLPLRDADEYRAEVEAALSVARPTALLVTEDDAGSVLPDWPTVVVGESSAGGVSLDRGRGVAAEAGTADEHTALVQFSSGSTGRPKGIRISRRALTANLRAIARWLGMREQDRTATWLPLYHDMGLIGTTLTPITTQTDVMLMSPLQFLRRPDAWLRCFGEQGATLTAAPAFGYGYAARKASADDVAGCDFSDWRVAIVGAEPIRRQVVETFSERFAPLGFRRRAFCPAYGLAEATLVVAATPVDAEPVARVSRGEGPGDELPGAGELLGSGAPLEGFRVEVVGEDGKPAAEGTLGEIWVGGDSLADGYEPAGEPGFEDRWFKTGDMAVVVDGELFVHGRISDRFKLRGAMVLAEDAEFAIQQALGLPTSPVVVPARTEGAGLTVLVESGRAWEDGARASALDVIAGLFDGAEVDLVLVGKGGIPRTTSGKPRRRLCWRHYVLEVGE